MTNLGRLRRLTDDATVVPSTPAWPWHQRAAVAESLTARVAALEKQVQSLQDLTGRMTAVEMRLASVESQFLQFRTEVRDDFVRTRREITAEVRREITTQTEETRRYMRVLYEDLVSRITTIREG